MLHWTGVKLPGKRLPETSSSQERSEMPLTPSGNDRSKGHWAHGAGNTPGTGLPHRSWSAKPSAPRGAARLPAHRARTRCRWRAGSRTFGAMLPDHPRRTEPSGSEPRALPAAAGERGRPAAPGSRAHRQRCQLPLPPRRWLLRRQPRCSLHRSAAGHINYF